MIICIQKDLALNDLQRFKNTADFEEGSILSVKLFSIKMNHIVKSLTPRVEGYLHTDDVLVSYRSK